jgi:ribonuclease-3
LKDGNASRDCFKLADGWRTQLSWEVRVSKNSGALRVTPQELAGRLNLPFTDWLLLSRALTHRSYLNEHPEALEDNERLEFLGDAILDFVVGAWLYREFPEMPEGDLTRMRSALVQTETLASFARTIELGASLRMGRGEMQSGGNLRDALLCDAFEALIAAIYLNLGLVYVEKFIKPLLEEAAEHTLLNNRAEDPKSLLQEWAQGNGYGAPQYITKAAVGPDHHKMFEVEVFIGDMNYGKGNGLSKQAAEKDAARNVLQQQGVL